MLREKYSKIARDKNAIIFGVSENDTKQENLDNVKETSSGFSPQYRYKITRCAQTGKF